MKTKITGLIGLFLALSLSIWAQPQKEANAHKRIETARIAFFSQHLKLTPEEAKVFWPLYNQYQEAIDVQRIERREKQDAVRERLEDMTEDQINELIDSRLKQAEQALKARKEFLAELRKVLPPIKVAKYFRAEELFQRELMERMREEREQDRMRPQRPARPERRP